MKTVYRLELPTHKRVLIAQVNASLGVEGAKGYILWDDQNYPSHPNPLYRRRAFHMNVATGGVEGASPAHVLELMERPDCQHLVWVSRQIGESEPIRMVWVYAHELRHLSQDLENPLLSRLTYFLDRAYPRIEPSKRQIDIPGEFDAELAARDVVVELFGAEEYHAYIHREIEHSPEAERYFSSFDEIEDTWSGDPMVESLRIVCRHRKAFEQEQRRLRGEGHKLELDIDGLCGGRRSPC